MTEVVFPCRIRLPNYDTPSSLSIFIPKPSFSVPSHGSPLHSLSLSSLSSCNNNIPLPETITRITLNTILSVFHPTHPNPTFHFLSSIQLPNYTLRLLLNPFSYNLSLQHNSYPHPISTICNPNTESPLKQQRTTQIQKQPRFQPPISFFIISPIMKSFLGFILGIALICGSAAAKSGSEVFCSFLFLLL